MSFELIDFIVSDSVARLTFNRPDRLNSFTAQMHVEVAEALTQVADRTSGARVLVITGAGRGFCAGQDLADRAVAPGGDTVDLGDSVERYYNPLIRRLVSLDMPVICSVNGVAAGAGANIALACDIVIAARSARFIQSFANIGLIPDSGGTWFLPRLVGLPRALGMALSAEPVTAEQAESWGLIWKCVDDAALAEATNALAKRFATGPTAGLAAIKHALRNSGLKTLDDELVNERDLMRRLGNTADYREGVAAFSEKRPPLFTGQ